MSVTQSFNTTTSMGRLTLNVLLSFAQFEREVTSERIRDKIAASKRKGLWVGGMVPLGYEAKDKKIWVVEEEAERVRLIFNRYLELGSLDKLMRDLHERGVVTKVRRLSHGRTIGGIPFTRGPLAALLRNRFYIGEVLFKGEVCPAEHAPILSLELFEAVQQKLAEQRRTSRGAHRSSSALLLGKLFDDRGNRMTPAHANKGGRRYRYYVSCALAQGRHEEVGSVSRVSATTLESTLISALREHCPDHASATEHQLVERWLERVTISSTEVEITFTPLHPDDARDGQPSLRGRSDNDAGDAPLSSRGDSMHLPWSPARPTRRREIILPSNDARDDKRPMRSETRDTLVRAIALGRRWLDDIVSGRASDPADIAAREGCSTRQVTRTISLAFLSPDLVKAALEGRLPRGIGFTRLCDPPIEWSRQPRLFGLALQ